MRSIEMKIFWYIFLASFFLFGCKKKPTETFEYTRPPEIDFPDDDDLDDLPEAGEEEDEDY